MIVKRSSGVHYNISKKQMDWLNSGKNCPNCGLPKEEFPRRKDWRCCSIRCTQDLLKLTTYWPALRIDIFRRDGWACVKCGRIDKSKKGCNFVADHIVPIALGGPEWDINNIQTLCISCNKIKTRCDAADIAKQRKIDKIIIGGQTTL